jgi:hypothetical protein
VSHSSIVADRRLVDAALGGMMTVGIDGVPVQVRDIACAAVMFRQAGGGGWIERRDCGSD